MLNSIMTSLKGDLLPQLTSQFGLSSDKAESSIALAKDNVAGGLSSEVSKGNFGAVQNMFSEGSSAQGHPLASNITNNYIGDLTSKLGLSNAQSTSIANFIMPMIFQKLGMQMKGQGKEGIMSMLGGMGGKGSVMDKLPGGLGGKIGGMFNK